jgi:PAS domain S-box-containing protein
MDPSSTRDSLSTGTVPVEGSRIDPSAELVFRRALENSLLVGVAVVDCQGVQSYVSPSFYRMVGWEEAELLGKSPPFVYWPEEELPAIRAAMEKTIRGGAPDSGFELIFRRRNGERFPVLLLISPLQAGLENPSGWVACVYDLTERKLADEELRRSQAQLADFVENASIGIHWVGPDGTILWANRAELEMLGYARDEYIGRSIAQFHADLPVIDDILCRLKSNRVLKDFRARLRCKDGSIKHVLIDSNVYWEGDRFVHTRCFTRDVTPQTAALESLRERESRLRAIFEQSTVGIFQTGLDGRLLFTNHRFAELVGRSPGEALSCRLQDLALPEERAALESALQTLPASGESAELEIPMTRGDGSDLWLCLSLNVTRDPGGRPISVLGVAVDITSRKHEELRVRTEHAVASVLADARTTEEALPRILQAVSNTTRWQRAHFFLVEDTHLRCACRWPPQGHDDPFDHATRDARLAMGEGLPGEVWASRRPLFAPDVARRPNFPRQQVAFDAGLHGALAFPILVENRVLGVMEFFSPSIRAPDDSLAAMLRAVGEQIGQFLERKRSEAALRESEQRWALAVNGANDGIWEWNTLSNTVYWSPRCKEMLGYSDTELQVSFGSVQALMHPDDRERGLARAREHLAGVTPFYEDEYRLRHKDGSYRWVLSRGLAVREAGSQYGRFVGSNTDITQRKLAEQLLRDNEQRLRLALEAGGMGTWEWIIATGEVVWSPGLEALHGLKPGTFNRTFEAFLADIHPDDRQWVPDHIRSTLQTGQDHRIEYRLQLPDGSIRWVEGRGKIVRDLTGAPERIVGVCMDITLRKTHETQRAQLLERERAAKAELQRANQLKDEFLAVLSHELRTPLTPVLAGAQMLERDAGLTPEAREAATLIRRNVQLEARLIDDLLDLTKISRGKLDLEPRNIDLHEKIRHVANMCAEDFAQKNIVPRVECSAAQHHTRADPTRIQQVIWNLLKNAAKFTAEGGRVTLRTVNPEPGWIALSIQDDGIGIAPENLSQIFAAFEQGGREITRRFGGLGLGLAITRALVTMHGGSIEAHSEGAGKGATFTVRLPVVPAAARKDTLNGDAPAAAICSSVLLVEDHADTRRIMARFLTGIGCTVCAAGSAGEALALLSDHSFDLVISDIGLPDRSGIELLREIHAQRLIPAIALTGFGTDDDVRKSREAGFHAHLTKPVDLVALEATLRRLTEESSRSTVPMGEH